MPNSKHILIVEDDPDLSSAFKSFLHDNGYDVATASDGQEALEYLRRTNHLPMLILLDLMMPRKDGFDFRLEQQDDPRLSSVPVVVMTAANYAPETRILLNVDDFLRKPFNLDSALSLIQQYVT